VTFRLAVPPAGIVVGIIADGSWNAGSAISSELSFTSESPGLLTVTVAACVSPTGTEPKDTESGFTVSGSVLYVIPQPVKCASASRQQAIRAAEIRVDKRRASLEQEEKERIGLVAFDGNSCTGASPSLGTQREEERAIADGSPLQTKAV
jgi:hypothetical protein